MPAIRPPLLQHQPGHVAPRRAKRHPRPDLPRALPHDVGHDTVDPDAREDERDRRESREQRQHQPWNSHRLLEDVRHEDRLADDDVGLDGAKRPTERRERHAGTRRRADEQRHRVRGLLLEREVEIGLRPVAKVSAPDVADDADDLEPGVAELDGTTHRPLAGEEAALDGLADDHDGPRRRRVRRLEQAPRKERYAESAEVAARRALPADVRRPLALRHGLVGALEPDGPAVARQRGDDGRAGLLDAGHGPQRAEGAVEEGAAGLGRTVTPGGDRHVEGGDTVDAEPRVHGLEAGEAARDEGRPEEQHDRERDLRHDEARRDPACRRARRRPSHRQRGRRAVSPGGHRGRGGDQHRRGDGDADGETDDPSIDASLPQAGR